MVPIEPLSRENNVGCVSGRHTLDRVVAQCPQIKIRKQRFPTAQHHRCQRQLDFVDKARLDILPDGRDAAADLDVLVPAASRARSSAASIPSVTK